MENIKLNTAHIINIGDEILSGHTVNTNSSYIASTLYDLGIITKKITAIPDSEQDIVDELESSMTLTGIIFITGGLGPTNDDLTKNVLCRHFGYKLKFRPEIWEHILSIFAKRNIIPDEINKEQALFPDSENVELLHNAAGTAPGMHFKLGEKHIFVMPGVPNEMRCLMKDHILPYLKENFSDDLYYRDINTTDISESSLYSILSKHPSFPFDCAIAFLPQGYGVTVRIKNFGERNKRKSLVDSASEIIESLIKENIFTFNMKSPQHELVSLLKKNDLKLSAAESCTGGLFMSNITNIPGSSGVFSEGFVTYSNDSKFKILNLNPLTLSISGAVSEETVSEMLDGLFAETKSDIVCAVSGIAGPDGGSEQKPVGTVFLGFSLRAEKKKHIRKFFFSGDRISIKEKASNKLMIEIIKHLKRK
jgi:nicotinamide-nucleotide amidase